MSLEEDLRARLTQAIKAKDLTTANIIRMINTKIMERRTAKGFSGQVNDELVREVIAAYKKSLDKAKEEYVALGAKGAEQVSALNVESEFCEQFLPKQLSRDQVKASVLAAIAEMGKDPKLAGRIVGAVMKQHKGQTEAGVVKEVVDECLK